MSGNVILARSYRSAWTWVAVGSGLVASLLFGVGALLGYLSGDLSWWHALFGIVLGSVVLGGVVDAGIKSVTVTSEAIVVERVGRQQQVVPWSSVFEVWPVPGSDVLSGRPLIGMRYRSEGRVRGTVLSMLNVQGNYRTVVQAMVQRAHELGSVELAASLASEYRRDESG